jgi:hypothetical protein
MMDAAIGIGANLHCLSALAPVHDDGLRLFDFQLDVLIPPKGAPWREFQADEICTRVALLSSVFAT